MDWLVELFPKTSFAIMHCYNASGYFRLKISVEHFDGEVRTICTPPFYFALVGILNGSVYVFLHLKPPEGYKAFDRLLF